MLLLINTTYIHMWWYINVCNIWHSWNCYNLEKLNGKHSSISLKRAAIFHWKGIPCYVTMFEKSEDLYQGIKRILTVTFYFNTHCLLSSYLQGFRTSFSIEGLDILNIIYLLLTMKNLQKTPNCKHMLYFLIQNYEMRKREGISLFTNSF